MPIGGNTALGCAQLLGTSVINIQCWNPTSAEAAMPARQPGPLQPLQHRNQNQTTANVYSDSIYV